MYHFYTTSKITSMKFGRLTLGLVSTCPEANVKSVLRQQSPSVRATFVWTWSRKPGARTPSQKRTAQAADIAGHSASSRPHHVGGVRPSSSSSRATTADPGELKRFRSLAGKWWDERGEFAALHAMNDLRVPFIRDNLLSAAHRGGPGGRPGGRPPLAGLKVLDVGCGGGLLTEPLARLGAHVLGIDPVEEGVDVARLRASRDPELRERVRYRACTLEELTERVRYQACTLEELTERVRYRACTLEELTERVRYRACTLEELTERVRYRACTLEELTERVRYRACTLEELTERVRYRACTLEELRERVRYRACTLEELTERVRYRACTLEELTERVRYRACTLEELTGREGEGEGEFDAVVASEVVEHLAAGDLETFVRGCDLALRPGGSLFVTTVNRTALSYALAVVAAERLLRVVPAGTHDWEKFVGPAELERTLQRGSDGGRFRVRSVRGMLYNPLTGRWGWSRCTAVNYALHAVKMG